MKKANLKKTCDMCGCLDRSRGLCRRDIDADIFNGGDGDMPYVACVNPDTCWDFYVQGIYVNRAFINGHDSFVDDSSGFWEN